MISDFSSDLHLKHHLITRHIFFPCHQPLHSSPVSKIIHTQPPPLHSTTVIKAPSLPYLKNHPPRLLSITSATTINHRSSKPNCHFSLDQKYHSPIKLPLQPLSFSANRGNKREANKHLRQAISTYSCSPHHPPSVLPSRSPNRS